MILSCMSSQGEWGHNPMSPCQLNVFRFSCGTKQLRNLWFRFIAAPHSSVTQFLPGSLCWSTLFLVHFKHIPSASLILIGCMTFLDRISLTLADCRPHIALNLFCFYLSFPILTYEMTIVYFVTPFSFLSKVWQYTHNYNFFRKWPG